MSVQQPQEVDVPDPDLLDVPSQRLPEADANRGVVDDSAQSLPDHLPDDANPADAYEQSIAVVFDEDDYR